MNGGQRSRSAVGGAVLGAVVLGALALAPVVATGSAAAAGTPGGTKVVLPQPAPQIPSNARALGPAPATQVLNLDVTLASQDPAGLAAAVAAVSTPGSPHYRQYLTAAQYAAEFGPSAEEVAQATSVLRSEGLTVGMAQAGSNLLPVSGSVAQVTAAFSTPMETVQSPNVARALVNTAAPQIPASLSGTVTGVVGLNGLFQEHSMLVPSPSHSGSGSGSSSGSASGSSAGAPAEQGHALAHAGTPQACPAAQSVAFGGTYTSTQLASVFGLNQIFGQGRTGVGQTIAIVEFEQYLSSDFNSFESCYGLSSPIRNVSIDGGPPGPPAGIGEAALDVELASFNAPGASLVVYGAPNNNDANALDLFNAIASQDAAQVVTTSWGNCEQFIQTSDPNYIPSESQIFQRMAVQGQTVIAASGDSGSEDCFPTDRNTGLAVDDPGSQPDVVSAGGTKLPSASASSQAAWNNCQGHTTQCAEGLDPTAPPEPGAGGGGFSAIQARPAYQNALSPQPPTRAVPDISYPSDPQAGGVVAFYNNGWTAFGGTSAAAPTNAGLFADINQGCFSRLGMALPALYAVGGTGNSNYTDITSGNNDFTDTSGGQFAAGVGYDAASGLGTPVDQNLVPSLQGGDGCPSVATVSPNTGPLSGSGAITISGGGFANATSVTFGSLGSGRIISQSASTISVVPPNSPGAICVNVTVANPLGVSPTSAADYYGYDGDLNCGDGYRFVASDGGIFDFGKAGFFGSAGSLHLNAPVVGMADTANSNGYWLVASDGGIFTYNAPFFGSMGGQHLNRPIVGMAATANGGGYWLVASDGGIFSFGNAQFFGSTGSMRLNKPIVGMAPAPDGGGYWLVASDGGIFSYGDAQFFGSTGSLRLNSPVVGMAAAPGGSGYWLVAADGGIFDYGKAGFFGSAGGIRLNEPVVGMAGTPDGGGYWLVASDGGIFDYGDAPFYGSTGSLQLNKPIVGMAST